jgi:excisionase family DNA binding protein
VQGTDPVEKSSERGSQLVGADVIAEEMQVSLSTVWRWSQAGTIPSIRVGRTVRFDLEAVKAALEARTVDAITEHNRKIRDRDIERGKETYGVDRGYYFQIIAHPGQALVTSNGQSLLDDPKWLRENCGCKPDQIERLIDTPHAPTPYTVDAELKRARQVVAELEAQQALHRAQDESIHADAVATVEEAEAAAEGEPKAPARRKA